MRRAAVGIVSISVLSGSAASAIAQQQQQQQKQQQQQPAAHAGDPSHAPQEPSSLQDRLDARVQQGGGHPMGKSPPPGSRSLFKAALASQSDTQQAKVGDVSFFAVPSPQPKMLKKHDQVTIIIREESTFSSDGSAEEKKTADFNAALEEFVQLKLNNWEIQGGALGQANPSIKAKMARNFKGEGKLDRTDKFTARIQAEVVDVKPNGTLVLQARKRIKTDDEEQQFTLSGTCRVEDITPDNAILSTQLFDLDLEKKNKGSVREATKRGWVPKLLDALNPF
jgi:flagellar L-ring protein precursor FlgH